MATTKEFRATSVEDQGELHPLLSGAGEAIQGILGPALDPTDQDGFWETREEPAESSRGTSGVEPTRRAEESCIGVSSLG